MADPVTDTVRQGSNTLSRVWRGVRGTIAALGVSTAIAAATGGISLTADAVVAAGQAVASTGALPIGPAEMASFTAQGLAHNLGGIADGAVWAAEGIHSLLEPS